MFNSVYECMIYMYVAEQSVTSSPHPSTSTAEDVSTAAALGETFTDDVDHTQVIGLHEVGGRESHVGGNLVQSSKLLFHTGTSIVCVCVCVCLSV